MSFINGMMDLEGILAESEGAIESEIEDEKFLNKRIIETDKLPTEELLKLDPRKIKDGPHKVALLAARYEAGLSIQNDGSTPPPTLAGLPVIEEAIGEAWDPGEEVQAAIEERRAETPAIEKKVAKKPRGPYKTYTLARILERTPPQSTADQTNDGPRIPTDEEYEDLLKKARDLKQIT